MRAAPGGSRNPALFGRREVNGCQRGKGGGAEVGDFPNTGTKVNTGNGT